MTIITIQFLEVSGKIKITTEDADPRVVRLQSRYADATYRMRLMRKVAGLIDEQAGGLVSGDQILQSLADLGYDVALGIFGTEWGKVRDLLRKHSAVDIQVYDELFQWKIPWELLCYDGNGELDDFVGYERNIYRVRPGSQGVTRPEGFLHVGFIPYSRVKETQDEAKYVSIVKGYHIDCEEYQGGYPRERASALERLLVLVKSMDILHFAGVIIPLQHAEKSWVLIDHELYLSEDDLKVRPDQTKRPLVIFNVRDNYCRDPEQIWSYINRFLNSNAVGVIASEFPVPSQLAAEFAYYFYKNLVQNGESLGKILANTKSDLLRNEGNPFAMFYAPYFDPSTRLEMKEELPMISIDSNDPPTRLIRRLLLDSFTALDLMRFCQDDPHFRPLMFEFKTDPSLHEVVQKVIDFCRTQLLWNELLKKIKEENPDQYARFARNLKSEKRGEA